MRLHALVAASVDVVYCMNPDWSEMWQLIGKPIIPDTLEPTDKWLDKYIDPGDQSEIKTLINRSLISKKAFQFEHRIIQFDGTLGWLFSSAVPLVDAQGGVIEWIVSATDVTERKLSLEKLTEKNRGLERDNVELAELAKEVIYSQHQEYQRVAGDIHDNLQQLLVAALMSAHLFIASHPSLNKDELETLIQTLNEAVAISRRITNTLGVAASLSTELPEALEDLAEDLKQNHELKVRVEIPPEMDVIPEVIGIVLYTSVREILVNTTRLGCKPDTRLALGFDCQRIHLIVEMSGFDSDLPVSTWINSQLYMTIEKRIKLLEGKIWVDVEPDKGVRVDMYIPYKADMETREKRLTPKNAEYAGFVPSEYKKTNSINILIADDHAVVRGTISDLLRQEKNLNVVAECQNGLEALEKSMEIYPDVIIMDINMPIMDGIQATHHIKKHCPQVKIIGLSAYSASREGKKMSAAGAELLLPKTIIPGSLINEIYKCVEL